MRHWESLFNQVLPRRMPAIIRVDGKAFHSYCRHLKKPFDERFYNCMYRSALRVAREIQNFRLAYGQSDEVSFLMVDDATYRTEPWLGGRVNKINSVTASLMTAEFNRHAKLELPIDLQRRTALFDCRVFPITREEVPNYFIWRQQDAERNSIQMLGRAYFSHKQLHNKSCSDIQNMLFTQKGINWADLEVWQKRGWIISRDHGMDPCPIFNYESPIFKEALQRRED